MAIIKWVFWITFWVLVGCFFHYTLPQVDIVRVTDTYEKRIDFGENSIFWAQADVGSDGTAVNRDVFFIQTRRAKGDVMVYRNEDTGWGWPPYFKFDTSNLQAEAADAKSTGEAAKYVAIKHYGWRNEFLSIFPNAISIRAVDGPDAAKGIPWLNIFILVVFFAIAYAIWVRWRRFRMARIDPTLEAIEDDLVEKRGRFSRWIGTWRAKDKS
ncbi:DUF1523 family protein [Sulfitobacter mediterraneus]|jgi:uncharacterized protein DUF1523|uniref:DUF1523 family protein n=1 Tax=Sulfitobacter TaxID=60136 RepID=UPI0019322145|nr:MULTISPECIES: DUF1523 family protein [Sulfitobacter]MBM1633194.1 DUF1523 family protein [Sulfitobacter mediterraneus]MBM1640672.1 DUF1523 family protein [Sulfitobacter mediterraneus]MBM1645059.1 DUF1523 family protein [Sulfitobacter mediterraneus]MBM1648792.1 DUF1523 family protein [Sulfitobacter mediterraneus]MBM1652813.1 DUF1523 family protein [Sulfitobacter mediterraneus]